MTQTQSDNLYDTNHYKHFHDLDDHHDCGFESPTLEQKSLISETVSKYEERLKLQRSRDNNTDVIEKHYEFDIHFHIMIDSLGNGNITDEVVHHSIDLLNEGFSGRIKRGNKDCYGNRMSGIDTSIRFVLKNITRTQRDDWLRVDKDDFYMRAEQSNALRMGTCSTLNVYTMTSDVYGGWASGPIMCNPEHFSLMDGIWINYATLPKSTCSQKRPVVLIHEVGHWVGLDHVFEGGCADYFGDGVKDTPYQKEVNNGCPIGSDTCPGGGQDSIHNFMAYTDNCCKYSFTEGQIVRMHALLDRWRSDPYRPANIYDDLYEYYDDDDDYYFDFFHR